jgi:acetylornithine deacetylase/succinyl-diaminopimelate desuccinylase-like protein
VKFVIEGEEEIGSENLGKFLEKYKHMLAADFIVLSDTANFDTGVPALTYQLRGIVQVDLEVKVLDHPVHSGMWGGPVPDPCRSWPTSSPTCATRTGRSTSPASTRRGQAGKKQLKRIRSLPFDEKKFKKDAGTVKGTKLWGEKGYSVYEQIWTRPSLTVIATESHEFAGSSNQIVDSAAARLSLRTVPDMDGRKAGEQLVKKLTKKPPFGVEVTAKVNGSTPGGRPTPTAPRSRRRAALSRPGSRRTRP